MQDIQQMLDALSSGGLGRAVVVDLSREEIGVPVVKIIVPGLQIGLHQPTSNFKRLRPAAKAGTTS